MTSDEENQPGQDSFMDVVANMTGILIIMVIIVGVRVRRVPDSDLPTLAIKNPVTAQANHAAEDAAKRDAEAAIEAARQANAESQSVLYEVKQLVVQQQELDAQMALREQQRGALATMLTGIQEGMKDQRSGLTDKEREQFELERQRAIAKEKLDRLERARIDALTSIPNDTVPVQNLPTPISKTALGKEIHFRLRGGKIAIAPVDQLVTVFQSDAKSKLYRLQDVAEMEETIGPIEGFRMRYYLGRFDPQAGPDAEPVRGGPLVRLIRWELLPTQEVMGETLEQALAPGSRFRRATTGLKTQFDVVTIWTYDDSFPELRRLKAELHAQGISAAARPLPPTELIGGSPSGTRSAAQ